MGERRPDRPDGPAADYVWTHEVTVSLPDRRSAEDWLRAAWEEEPVLLQRALLVAWKLGLGLRLAPMRTPHTVLGWPVTESGRRAVVVTADSPIMQAQNSLAVTDDRIVWATAITPTHPVGRLLWAAARPVHERLVPWLLARAIRRHPVAST